MKQTPATVLMKDVELKLFKLNLICQEKRIAIRKLYTEIAEYDKERLHLEYELKRIRVVIKKDD